MSVNVENNENNCVSPKNSECPSELTSPSRITTRKSGHAVPSPSIQHQASPSSASCDRSLPNSPTSSIPHIEHLLSLSASSNCFSSSNSSSQSILSETTLRAQQYHLVQNSAALQDMLSWRMVPEYLYEQIPAAPSLVYGAHHLLRLFGKLQTNGSFF